MSNYRRTKNDYVELSDKDIEEQSIQVVHYPEKKNFPVFIIVATIAQITLLAYSIWLNKGFEPFSVNLFKIIQFLIFHFSSTF